MDAAGHRHPPCRDGESLPRDVAYVLTEQGQFDAVARQVEAQAPGQPLSVCAVVDGVAALDSVPAAGALLLNDFTEFARVAEDVCRAALRGMGMHPEGVYVAVSRLPAVPTASPSIIRTHRDLCEQAGRGLHYLLRPERHRTGRALAVCRGVVHWIGVASSDDPRGMISLGVADTDAAHAAVCRVDFSQPLLRSLAAARRLAGGDAAAALGIALGEEVCLVVRGPDEGGGCSCPSLRGVYVEAASRAAWRLHAPPLTSLADGWGALRAAVDGFAAWCTTSVVHRLAVLVAMCSTLVKPVHVLLVGNDPRLRRLLEYAARHTHRSAIVAGVKGMAFPRLQQQPAARKPGPAQPPRSTTTGAAGMLAACNHGVLVVDDPGCVLSDEDILRLEEGLAGDGAVDFKGCLGSVPAPACHCVVLSRQSVVGDAAPRPCAVNELPDDLWLKPHAPALLAYKRPTAFVSLCDIVLGDVEEGFEAEVEQIVTGVPTRDPQFGMACRAPCHAGLERLLASAVGEAPALSPEAHQLLQDFYLAVRRRFQNQSTAGSAVLLAAMVKTAQALALLMQRTEALFLDALVAVALAARSVAYKTNVHLIHTDIFDGGDVEALRTEVLAVIGGHQQTAPSLFMFGDGESEGSVGC